MINQEAATKFHGERVILVPLGGVGGDLCRWPSGDL